jgi:capsular polysaccharide biosynthesis protein/Flp pilus assembly protein TadD
LGEHATRAARQQARAGHDGEAAALYRQALAEWPEDDAVLLRLGVIERRRGRRGVAFDLLRGALVLQPRHAVGYADLVPVGRPGGGAPDPRRLLRAALALDPAYTEALFTLNSFLEREGRLEEQLRRHYLLLLHRPDSAHAQGNLGVILRRKTRGPAARTAARRAIILAPEDATHRFNLATIDLGLGDLAAAELGRRKAVLLDPVLPNAWHWLARLALERGRLAPAALYAAAAHRLVPQAEGIATHFARLLVRTGRVDAGRRLYERGLPADRRVEIRRSFRLDSWCAGNGQYSWSADRAEAGRRRHQHLRAPYVARLADAIVLAGEWIVAAGTGAVFVEQICHSLNYLAHTRINVLDYLDESRVVMAIPATPRPVEAAAVLIGGGAGNYFHWLTDHLGRLAFIAGDAGLERLPLLVDSPLNAFQRETLARVGYGPERLIGIPAGEAIRCRDLVVPSLGGYRSMIEPIAIDWLRARFAQAPGGGERRRLLVSRAEAAARRLVNEAAIEHALSRFGFETVTPGRMSFAEQIAAFADAELIVGAHGAGLANMLFAPADAAVVDLNFGASPVPCYEEIARIVGQRYRRVMGEPVSSSFVRPQSADFAVDPTAVVRAISELLDGR